MTCAGCVIRRRAVSVFRRERAQCRRSVRWRRRLPGAPRVRGARRVGRRTRADGGPLSARRARRRARGPHPLLTPADRAPLGAGRGRRRLRREAGAPRRRPAARAGLDPVAPPGRPRARPLRGPRPRAADGVGLPRGALWLASHPAQRTARRPLPRSRRASSSPPRAPPPRPSRWGGSPAGSASEPPRTRRCSSRSRPRAVRRERHPRRAATASLRSHRDVADPRRERPRPVRPGGRGRCHLPHGVRGALRALRRRPFPGRHRSCGRRRRGDGVHRAGPRPRQPPRRACDRTSGASPLRSQAPRSVPGALWLLPVGGESLQQEIASEALGSASVVRAGAWLAASGAVLAAGRSAPRLAAAASAPPLLATLLPLSAVKVQRPWDRFPAPAAVMFGPGRASSPSRSAAAAGAAPGSISAR